MKLKNRKEVFDAGKKLHPKLGGIAQNDYNLDQINVDYELALIDDVRSRLCDYRGLLLRNLDRSS